MFLNALHLILTISVGLLSYTLYNYYVHYRILRDIKRRKCFGKWMIREITEIDKVTIVRVNKINSFPGIRDDGNHQNIGRVEKQHIFSNGKTFKTLLNCPPDIIITQNAEIYHSPRILPLNEDIEKCQKIIGQINQIYKLDISGCKIYEFPVNEKLFLVGKMQNEKMMVSYVNNDLDKILNKLKPLNHHLLIKSAAIIIVSGFCKLLFYF